MTKRNKKRLAVFLVVMISLLSASVYAAMQFWSNDVKETSKPEALVKLEQHKDDGTGVMVLNYHKVEDVEISLSINVRDFEKHMKWLKEKGYNSITPDELYDFVANGASLPPNPVLITFDDGYADNYRNAYPILNKYGFKGTIFVVTSFLGKYDNYLTWEQCSELVKNGFYIESHTANHKIMTEISDEDLMEELRLSRKEIKDRLGIDADYVAYPTGTYNLHIAQLVKDAGYKAAFTIKYDNVSRNSNVYALERVPIFHTMTTNKDFLERIDYMPIYDTVGWTKS